MFKIGICDDNRELCNWLDQLIWEYGKQNKIQLDIEVFYSGEDLCNYIQTEDSFHLLFLDIELEDMDGIQVGDLIRNKLNDPDTEIVYISGEPEYAMELFNKHPLDFLIKPLKEDDIIAKVRQALDKWGRDSSFFYFKIGAETHRVKCHEILYFESNGRKINLTTSQGSFEFYGKLSEIKEQLPQQFMQIHKSFIVNFDKVVKYDRDFVTMNNDMVVKIGKTYRSEYEERVKKRAYNRGTQK